MALVGPWVSPPTCSGCDTSLEAESVFCAACSATVVAAPPLKLHLPTQAVATQALATQALAPRALAPQALATQALAPRALPVHAAALHGGAVAEALNRLKHRDRPDLARPLGHLLRAHLRIAPLPACDAIVPVPLHRARLAARGFNQAALLGRELARELDVPLLHGLLRRERLTAPQQGLRREARRHNLEGAFSARAPPTSGLAVLLVDDVCTTGSTLTACATTLLAVGVTSVGACVVARAEGRGGPGRGGEPAG